MLFPIYCTRRHKYSHIVFNLELFSPFDFTIFFFSCVLWFTPSPPVCNLFCIPCCLYVTPRSLSPHVSVWTYFTPLQQTWTNHMDFLFLSFTNCFLKSLTSHLEFLLHTAPWSALITVWLFPLEVFFFFLSPYLCDAGV